MISTSWSGYRQAAGPATEMGYALVAAQGEMCGFGSLGEEWEDPVLTPGQQLAGLAFTPSGRGCWLVSTDGAVVCRGDAPYIGCPKDLGVVVPVRRGGGAAGRARVLRRRRGRRYLHVRVGRLLRIRVGCGPESTHCGHGHAIRVATGTGRWRRMAVSLRSGPRRSSARERRSRSTSPGSFPSPARHRGVATGWPRAPATCSRSETPSTSAAWPTSGCPDPSSACALPGRYSATGWPARPAWCGHFGDTYFLGCVPPATLAPPFVAFGAAGAV